MFYPRVVLVDLWLLLEADRSVIAFCERPGYVHLDGMDRLADFWVRYAERQEKVALYLKTRPGRSARGRRYTSKVSAGELDAEAIPLGGREAYAFGEHFKIPLAGAIREGVSFVPNAGAVGVGVTLVPNASAVGIGVALSLVEGVAIQIGALTTDALICRVGEGSG
jgi:hypothetical protein